MTASARLAALRAAMAAAGVDAYLIPHGDEHRSEYPAPYAERLMWLTDFSGSAGMAIVMADKAAIFIDGRYTLQVRDQVDGALYAYRQSAKPPKAGTVFCAFAFSRLGSCLSSRAPPPSPLRVRQLRGRPQSR
jgi:Xaa-Pro aminopeptidase